MEAGGTFKSTSRVQPASLPAVELFERAAKDVELSYSPKTIVIADYGASAGHNSLLPTGAAISVVRDRTERGRPIVVFHADVAENDYMRLFDSLTSDPQSYLHDDPAAFASAIGRYVRASCADRNRDAGLEFLGRALAFARARGDTGCRAQLAQPRRRRDRGARARPPTTGSRS